MPSDDFRPGKELNKLFNDLKEYIEIKYDILKLELAERSAEFLSSFYSFFIFIVLIPFSLFFLSFAAAYYLGEELDSIPLGFLIIGAFYVMLCLLFIILRNWLITRPLVRFVLNLFFNKSKK